MQFPNAFKGVKHPAQILCIKDGASECLISLRLSNCMIHTACLTAQGYSLTLYWFYPITCIPEQSQFFGLDVCRLKNFIVFTF